MTIPNAGNTVIPAVGGTKARYFRAHGYDESNVDALARGLREIASSEATSVRESAFGTKYVASGDLKTPRGTVVRIETVWIIETGSDQPRLVTAYPV